MMMMTKVERDVAISTDIFVEKFILGHLCQMKELSQLEYMD
jgi:hypothetical protein